MTLALGEIEFTVADVARFVLLKVGADAVTVAVVVAIAVAGTVVLLLELLARQE
eukprot:CAMPEP_0168854050 /NCGR_PEP_ID=MMETSP0727-20121128/13868_1 /TAXON_ID=265536 /ORGANISM="Amphiprora sp., Strain CCMP467" /LENGTH=53 /DNA_ID=CAMNT_0008908343 /DNA_START=395 /DNA_END=556 /DNA_ORIENTATION=+